MDNSNKHFFPDKPWLPSPDEWKNTWRDDWRIMGQKLPAIDQQEVDLSFEFMCIDDQWKISGGNFIEMLDAIYLPEEANPSTGDNGSLVFAPIVTIGMLIGIIYQKKRYSEFLN